MPYYAIRHLTRYRYSAPVRENITEARMQPRTEGIQRCVQFKLTTLPQAQVTAFQDHLGNIVHHFDIPGSHVQLQLTAEALVELQTTPVISEALSVESWSALENLRQQTGFWDFLHPSRFAQPTKLLQGIANGLGLTRQIDPLTALKTINHFIYEGFAYAPQSTRVDSSIDEAITARQGVCQDFSHIMIALGRSLSIPCRYVSGYLFHRLEDHDRSAEDASHAWVEAFLPELGWIGFDPTNNLITADRHIRVAIGRDYADVPPTRGVFKGSADDELTVGVRVTLADAPPEADEAILPDTPWISPETTDEATQWQQQQQ